MKNLILITVSLLLSCNFSRVLTESNKFDIFGDKRINAQFYENKKTINGDYTNQLIIFFPENKFPKYITIVLEHNLVGMPEKENGIKIINNKMNISDESLMIMPISEGPNKLTNVLPNNAGVISFVAFGDLLKYGEKITIQSKK